MTRAHATPDLLAAYAAGSLSEGLSLLVASHLTFCPGCRGGVARLESLGGALLRDADAVATTPACLAGALARIGEAAAQPAAPARIAASAPLPAPLLAHFGQGAQDIRWRFLLPGLSEHRLQGFEGEEVRLMRARPGARIPQHTHVGIEATLILAGRMRDGDQTFARGDVAIADCSHDHRPLIDEPETCLCLVVLTGPMRFTGPVGRALNLFTG